MPSSALSETPHDPVGFMGSAAQVQIHRRGGCRNLKIACPGACQQFVGLAALNQQRESAPHVWLLFCTMALHQEKASQNNRVFKTICIPAAQFLVTGPSVRRHLLDQGSTVGCQ
jgi:hypothetical protein